MENRERESWSSGDLGENRKGVEKDGWNDATPQKDQMPMPIALGIWGCHPFHPEPSLGLGGLIARSFLCTAQRSQGPKGCRIEDLERERDAEPCIASLLVCLSREDPRRFQCSVPHWQSPGQIVFVSQEPAFTTPKSFEQRGGRGARGASILPTGRPLCTISRRRADQWRAPTNGLVLITKRLPNPETERKKPLEHAFRSFPLPSQKKHRWAARHLSLFNHVQRVCPWG
ncbi:hypothetical protein B0T18DRAFT_80279 [Schizothecium vesticola]|uniref:Uncharacterized protein n=1 Tax=Schizothecium vesticola TaxID=314040 RepID=A0AA40KAB4_9PEZI|nr:hypothetical protein B0T18DRAFT_80279 [Schizothecium vesticola]